MMFGVSGKFARVAIKHQRHAKNKPYEGPDDREKKYKWRWRKSVVSVCLSENIKDAYSDKCVANRYCRSD